jgi:hypothetical protein
MDCIDLAQARDQWRVLVNTMMNRSWAAAQLAVSQEGLSSVKLVVNTESFGEYRMSERIKEKKSISSVESGMFNIPAIMDIAISRVYISVCFKWRQSSLRFIKHHVTKIWGNWGPVSYTLNLNTRWRRMISFMPRSLYFQYPLHRR